MCRQEPCQADGRPSVHTLGALELTVTTDKSKFQRYWRLLVLETTVYVVIFSLVHKVNLPRMQGTNVVPISPLIELLEQVAVSLVAL